MKTVSNKSRDTLDENISDISELIRDSLQSYENAQMQTGIVAPSNSTQRPAQPARNFPDESRAIFENPALSEEQYLAENHHAVKSREPDVSQSTPRLEPIISGYPIEDGNGNVTDDKEPDTRSWMSRTGTTVVKSVFWGLAGFVVGIAFWNAFGFWKFVGSAMLTDTKSPSAVELAVRKPPVGLQDLVNSAAHSGPQACVELVLDRERAVTFSRPCRITANLHNSNNPLRTAKQDRTR